MHHQARQFALWVKQQFPEFFSGRRVLDVGGGDINGNNRGLFSDCEYHANDVADGKNVTIALPTALLPFSDASFDTIISTECFEHDPQLSLSLATIARLLAPGGLFFFTAASAGRAEHGTRRKNPEDSLGVTLAGWQDFYHNVNASDLKPLGLGVEVTPYRIWYSAENCDIYFIGFRAGGPPKVIPPYTMSQAVEVLV
jgi:SAM-dependent methyltransferase